MSLVREGLSSVQVNPNTSHCLHFILGWYPTLYVPRACLVISFQEASDGPSQAGDITWSVHQHQVARTVSPKMKPGHGMSPFTGSRNMWKASGRGRWQVVLGTVTLGMAWLYRCCRPGYQPTSWKPVGRDMVWEVNLVVPLMPHVSLWVWIDLRIEKGSGCWALGSRFLVWNRESWLYGSLTLILCYR